MGGRRPGTPNLDWLSPESMWEHDQKAPFREPSRYPCIVHNCWVEAVDLQYNPGWVMAAGDMEPMTLNDHYRKHHPDSWMVGVAKDAIQIDEERIISETGGAKGRKRIRLHAIPWESTAELGRVFAFGESKYDDYNFRKGYLWSLGFDAMQRHIGAWWNREDRDGESGLHHLAHAVWHGIVLLFFALTERGIDDRPT